jgi:signal transduction protein with GAF and PtsI domain
MTAPLTDLLKPGLDAPPGSPAKPSSDLDDLIKLVSNVTDAFTAALFVTEDKGESLVLTACHSLSRNVVPGATIGLGEGLIGWVAKHNKPVHATQFDRDTRSLMYYQTDESIKSFMAVPVDGGRGVLAVDSKHTFVFTDKAQKILGDLAVVVGNTLRFHQVVARERRYAALLDFAYEVENLSLRFRDKLPFLRGVLAAGLRFTGTESAFFCVLNKTQMKYSIEAIEGPAGRHLIPRTYALNQGLMGWLMREKRPLVLPRIKASGQRSHVFTSRDPFGSFNCFIGVPVADFGCLVGAMGFAGSTPRALPWHDDEVNGLWLAGHRLASTLSYFQAIEP